MAGPSPTLEIQHILRTYWEAGETVYGQVPSITTGEYRRGDTRPPAVTITGADEGPLAGSNTGYMSMDGAGGGGIQKISGAVSVNCVAGSYDDLEGAGPSGQNLNPKQLREQLYQHAAQLLVDHQENTDLEMIAPGDAHHIEEAFGSGDGVSHEFRIQFRARYLYERRPRSQS